MKTTARRRLARFTGLVLLSLLVVAAGVQVAQAAASSATPAAGTQGRGGVALLATTPAAGTQGRGGVAALATTSSAGTQGTGPATAFARGRGGIASVRGVTAAQPGLSGTPSTASWIIVGSALAVLMMGLAAWALISRRRQRDEPLSVAFCAQHPEHAMCGTA
jgi:hypothetical protein